jgi:hypothetical protein
MEMTIQRNFGYTGPVKRPSYLYKVDGKIVGRWVPAFRILQLAYGKSYIDLACVDDYGLARRIMHKVVRRRRLIAFMNRITP